MEGGRWEMEGGGWKAGRGPRMGPHFMAAQFGQGTIGEGHQVLQALKDRKA